MNKFIYGILAVAIAIGGYIGFQKYQASQVVQASSPMVKEATLRTKVVADLLINPGNATWEEAFKSTAEAVTKIKDLSLVVQSQDASSNPEAINAATDYMSACQTFIRSANALFRARFEHSSAIENADKLLEEKPSSNPYIQEHRMELLENAIKRLEAVKNKLVDVQKEAQQALSMLKEATASAGKFYPEDALLNAKLTNQLDEYFGIEDSTK